MIATTKLASTLLIVGGFAAWLAVGPLFGDGLGGYIVGALAFVIVACFLPETRRVTFFSRRSALGVVGFFMWIASNQFFRQHRGSLEGIGGPVLRATLEVSLPILFGVGIYWLSVFLIRGFRATPEYENNKGEQGVAPPPAAHSESELEP